MADQNIDSNKAPIDVLTYEGIIAQTRESGVENISKIRPVPYGLAIGEDLAAIKNASVDEGQTPEKSMLYEVQIGNEVFPALLTDDQHNGLDSDNLKNAKLDEALNPGHFHPIYSNMVNFADDVQNLDVSEAKTSFPAPMPAPVIERFEKINEIVGGGDASPNIENKQITADDVEQTAASVLSTLNQLAEQGYVPQSMTIFSPLLEQLSDIEGKTIQFNPNTREFISTDVATGRSVRNEITETISINGVVQEAKPSNPDDFITIVENGAPVQKSLQDLIFPSSSEADQPPAADTKINHMQQEETIKQQQKIRDDGILRETTENDAQKGFGGFDFQQFFVAFVAFMNGDKNAFTDMMKTETIVIAEGKNDAAAPATAADKPEETTLAQEEPKKGYVNEDGQGPLLTLVNKPEDPSVSPLIATALKQDTYSESNILTNVFSMNSANQIGDAHVVDVPFISEPVTADIVTSDVNQPSTNIETQFTSRPMTMNA